MADQEAWLELADLYISQQDWNKAAFCLEELILHNPNNHLYLQRYAEIKYTQVRLFQLMNQQYLRHKTT
jgi:ER membrane protein complex subunit 2